MYISTNIFLENDIFVDNNEIHIYSVTTSKFIDTKERRHEIKGESCRIFWKLLSYFVYMYSNVTFIRLKCGFSLFVFNYLRNGQYNK